MIVRAFLMGLGVTLVTVGLLWVGQGLGWVRWPASSFMIDQSPWIARGAILAVVGLAVVLFGRRVRR